MQDKMFQNLRRGKITVFWKIFNFNLKTCNHFFKSTASVVTGTTNRHVLPYLCDACYTMYISFIIFCNNIQIFKSTVF